MANNDLSTLSNRDLILAEEFRLLTTNHAPFIHRALSYLKRPHTSIGRPSFPTLSSIQTALFTVETLPAQILADLSLEDKRTAFRLLHLRVNPKGDTPFNKHASDRQIVAAMRMSEAFILTNSGHVLMGETATGEAAELREELVETHKGVVALRAKAERARIVRQVAERALAEEEAARQAEWERMDREMRSEGASLPVPGEGTMERALATGRAAPAMAVANANGASLPSAARGIYSADRARGRGRRRGAGRDVGRGSGRARGPPPGLTQRPPPGLGPPHPPGLGPISPLPFGPVPPPGLGPVTPPGFGPSPPPGLGPMSQLPFGSPPPPGLGPVSPPGFGPSPPPGLEPMTQLPFGAPPPPGLGPGTWSGFGTSPPPGLGPIPPLPFGQAPPPGLGPVPPRGFGQSPPPGFELGRGRGTA